MAANKQLSEYSDEELIEEVEKRGLSVHIDGVELTVYLNNKEIGELHAK